MKLEEQFWPKVDVGFLGECWKWAAARNSAGYGQLRRGGVTLYAHRVAYELLVGPIPDGLVVDHLCRNRACVNPIHLEPVSHRENGLRGEGPSGFNHAKTHCKRGHEFTPENTAVHHVEGNRRCRICTRASNRRSYHRQAALAHGRRDRVPSQETEG